MEFTHEIIIPNEDLPFKMFLFEGGNGNFFREKHWHRAIEIFAVFEGSMNLFINDKSYPLESGQFILINSNEVHSIDAPDPNRTLVLQIALKTFEEYYTGDQFIQFSHRNAEYDSRVMELLKRIFDTYQKKEYGYAPAYLSRMFQKYAGINYKDYLNNIRMEYAFQELSNTDHTISETALNNGFPNSKAFSREFRKKYGKLPSEYRKMG